MDFTKIIAVLRRGVEFAEGLAPLTSLIPGAGLVNTAVSAVSAVSEVLQNVQERIAEGKIVASSSDQAEIRALAQRLSAINDELANYVDNS